MKSVDQESGMNVRSSPTFVLSAALAFALTCPGSFGAENLHRPIQATKVIDLTHTMHEGMPFWPGGVPFRKTRLVDYDKGYRLHKFHMGENTGTHVDAPSHFAKGKRPIDQIPLADLIVPAVVVDVQDKAAANPDYQLSVADLIAWEARHGTIPAGVLVILNTGWHKRFADAKRYINMDAKKIMHFPGYGRESAALLLKRDVTGIGIDTLSIDHGASKDFATHSLVLGANKYMAENMSNLDALPPTGAVVVIGVLPVREGSQAPARILALLP
jgi:kynurenine formamidase